MTTSLHAKVRELTPKDAADEGRELSLPVKGMTCAGCANHVAKMLRALPGVFAAEVSFTLEQADLRFDPGLLDPARIADAIRAIGYQVPPANATAKKEAHAHYAHHASSPWQSRLLILSVLLTVPLAAQMAGEVAGLPFHLAPLVQMAIASLVQFVVGWHFYKAAWTALRHGNGTMDQLVALGTSAAYGLSAYRTLWPEAEGADALYFEASAIIITLVLLGKWLENRAKQGTSAAIRALMRLRPETARLVKDGKEIEVPVETLAVGDVVLVKPGEKLPVDGEVVAGASEVDESLITGESQPVEKEKGASVTGGSVNGSGLLRVVTTRVGAETTLARIIHLVEGAQASRAPVQKLVDQVSAVFVPAVLFVAVFTFAVQWLFTGAIGLAVIAAVSVLVIACPCALGLATPTAIVAGMGIAARHGILIKDLQALERTRKVTVMALDKTGTLTEGQPRVSRVLPAEGVDRETLLLLAASAQQGSEHPLARAILDAAGGETLKPLEHFQSFTGRGLEAVVAGERLIIGSRRLMTESKIATASLDSQAIACESEGSTVMWVARAGEAPRLLGAIVASDPVRPNAAEALGRLQAMGIAIVMMTGDNQRTAAAVAGKLGIDRVLAELLPEQKIAEILRLREAGETVAMVGDGINDAPALAAADVGIAMGTGTDVAMAAAGVTLMRGEPLLLAETIRVSRATVSKIRQNLFWAFIYNVVGIPLAATGLLSPIIAGGAMAFSSVSVVSNSLLLARWRPLNENAEQKA
ncbi:MAG: cadmium-translocating P-type ATPase [Alphaproteobacteria bacterium]|nr:cadmium-translocating P-type ATPase [Alphaproteobacteria bacterium]